jgi:hypothetical protein
MRPCALLAGEVDRIERRADVSKCKVVMPVNRVVMPLVIRVVERANLYLCTDRRAESGAVVILTGAAVKVAHCHSSQLFP